MNKLQKTYRKSEMIVVFPYIYPTRFTGVSELCPI